MPIFGRQESDFKKTSIEKYYEKSWRVFTHLAIWFNKQFDYAAWNLNVPATTR